MHGHIQSHLRTPICGCREQFCLFSTLINWINTHTHTHTHTHRHTHTHTHTQGEERQTNTGLCRHVSGLEECVCVWCVCVVCVCVVCVCVCVWCVCVSL